jgi:hypothetical protein
MKKIKLEVRYFSPKDSPRIQFPYVRYEWSFVKRRIKRFVVLDEKLNEKD